MAFGKDETQLANPNMGTYRQNAVYHQASTRRSGGGGGGGVPAFVDRFKPSLHDVDLIRLIAGHYKVQTAVDRNNLITKDLPFFPYVEHFHGGLKKSSFCSGGPFAAFKDKRQPCRGCEIFWESMTQDEKTGKMRRGKTMSSREMFAFTVLHYATYARVPQIDFKTGAPRTSENGQQYLNWERVLPHERAKYVGAEQRHAHRLHWPMGATHYNTLWEYDEQIGASCSVCCGRDTIKSLAWCCSNPACGEGIIEMETTTLPPEQIKELTLKPATCPRCHFEGFLTEVFECANCTPVARAPRRATLFDVDLSVKRVEASNGESNQTALIITKWSDPRPIDPQFAELAKPWALDKTYAPTPMNIQVNLYGAATPARTPVNTGTTPYTR